MGPVRVVVLDVLGEDCFEVTAAEGEDPVEALGPDGARHALADCVGLGGMDGGLDDSGAVGGDDGVDGGGELCVAVAGEELDGFVWAASSVERLRACWVTLLVSGFEVMRAIRTKRLSWWMNTRTCSLRRRMVSTS